MSLEYKHLEPDQQIEAKLTISLSTESSIEWLKSNALKKSPQSFFSGSTDLKDFVNSQYVKRKDPTLSLAVARDASSHRLPLDLSGGFLFEYF